MDGNCRSGLYISIDTAGHGRIDLETSYIVILVRFIVLFMQHRKEKVWLKNYIQRKKRKEPIEMLELAKRFIEKECIIYTFNNQLEGVIKEICWILEGMLW